MDSSQLLSMSRRSMSVSSKNMVTIRKSKKSKANRLQIMFNNIKPLKRDDISEDPSDMVSENNYIRSLSKKEIMNSNPKPEEILESPLVKRRKVMMNQKSARSELPV